MPMLIIILLLLLESTINCLTGFSYIDELIAIGLIIFAVIKRITYNKTVFSKKEKITIRCLFGIGILGILGTLIYDYQNNWLIGFEGVFFTLKAFSCYFTYKFLFFNTEKNRKHEKILLNMIELSVFIISCIGLIDRFIEIFPTRDIRFGIETTSLYFSTPTALAFFASSSLIIVSYFRVMKFKNKRMLIIDIIECSFLIIITGRMKAVGFLLFLAIIYILFKSVKKFNIIYLVIPTIIVMFFASESIENYFFEDTSARGALLNTSLKIASTHPVGAGFSTFGTELSRRNYSKLYYDYGISNIYGLSKDYPAFICDSTWPAIIGETGFGGVLLTLMIIFNFYTYIPNKEKNKKYSFFVIATMTYLLFESIGDTIFMTSRGCLLLVFLSYIIIDFEKNDYNIEN